MKIIILMFFEDKNDANYLNCQFWGQICLASFLHWMTQTHYWYSPLLSSTREYSLIENIRYFSWTNNPLLFKCSITSLTKIRIKTLLQNSSFMRAYLFNLYSSKLSLFHVRVFDGISVKFIASFIDEFPLRLVMLHFSVLKTSLIYN